MAKELFRKVSLERLASPEQMDRLLTIVKVPGWIALFCLIILTLSIFLWSLFAVIPTTVNGVGMFFNPRAIVVINSHTEGDIERIDVKTGDSVKRGDELVSIRAHGSGESVAIEAPSDGIILEINAIQGDDTRVASTLMWLEKSGSSQEEDLIYSFFPVSQAAQIKEGMPALVAFNGVNPEKYGKMRGQVKRVQPFAASQQGEILRSIPSQQLRDFLSNHSASVIVEIAPTSSSSTPSGYLWTTEMGPPSAINRGSIGSVSVVIEERHPISYLFPVQQD